MITFKKRGYSEYDLRVLYEVLSDAELTIREKAGCDHCNTCKLYILCHDLSNVLEYIATLIPLGNKRQGFITMVTRFSYSGEYLEELREAMCLLTSGNVCGRIDTCFSCPLDKLCDEIAQIYDATRIAHKL